jgi:hypothetical protein
MTPLHDEGTQVWLPVSFVGTSNHTGFTALPPSQLRQLAEHFERGGGLTVSPEPLGIRDVFGWELESNLAAGRGSALDDFCLIVEGLCYGLLEPITFDLANLAPQNQRQKFRFDYHQPELRYLTVLNYRDSPGAAPTVAGSFAPDTLVCKPGVWRQRQSLQNKIEALRFETGPMARGLVEAFLKSVSGSSEMLWHAGLRHLLAHLPVSSDAGVRHQSNVGPCLLRTSPGVEAKQFFFPRYEKDYMPRFVQCLNGEATMERSQLRLHHAGQNIGSISLNVQGDAPRLHGLGRVTLDPQAANLPVRTDLEGKSKNAYLSAIRVVSANYDNEIESTSRRFRLPDSLSVAFYTWGDQAIQLLRGNEQPMVYGPPALAAQLNPRPHQVSIAPGLYDQDGRTFWVETLPGGRRAYYVERYDGVDIGELTALGYGLWKVFAGASWDPTDAVARSGSTVYLADQQGWLGLPANVITEKPMIRYEAIQWSGFQEIANSPEAPDLFREATKRYIAHCSDVSSPRGAKVTYGPIQIMNYKWFQRR